jgi:hypothetical protein
MENLIHYFVYIDHSFFIINHHHLHITLLNTMISFIDQKKILCTILHMECLLMQEVSPH